ncbi:cupin domain-containing protein [Heliomarina baculiformis]|uniref:cupin domain-containing protein n=1 Tax=Heliomarina baculiformis TaxID=2872036 RepID=UPI001EE2A0F5|nr:cupin domain-containing protein [Heliomarina baculiformis]
MDDASEKTARKAVIALGRDEGRRYEMGKLTALFKEDEAETGAGYSVSEWRMAPGQEGVGAHHHDANDEIFYVLEGTPELLTGEEWRSYDEGSFIRIPAGVTHDFRNPGNVPARLFNVFIPGGFERNMPEIVAWFAENP